jgi:hypothetical protein
VARKTPTQRLIVEQEQIDGETNRAEAEKLCGQELSHARSGSVRQ